MPSHFLTSRYDCQQQWLLQPDSTTTGPWAGHRDQHHHSEPRHTQQKWKQYTARSASSHPKCLKQSYVVDWCCWCNCGTFLYIILYCAMWRLLTNFNLHFHRRFASLYVLSDFETSLMIVRLPCHNFDTFCYLSSWKKRRLVKLVLLFRRCVSCGRGQVGLPNGL